MTSNINVLGSNKNIPGSLNQGKQANTQSKQLSTVNNTTNRPIAQSSMSGKRFHLLSDGVIKLEDGSKTPVSGYLEVVALFKDTSNKNWGRCLYWLDVDNNQHHLEVLDADLRIRSNKIIELLASGGLRIDNKADLIDYLLGFKVTRRLISTNRLGWFDYNNTKHFVLSKSVIGLNASDIIYVPITPTHRDVYSRETLQSWIDNIGKHCVHSSRCVLAVCVALATPLLHLVNSPNVGFHIRGSSSLWKSLVLSIATSVQGAPTFKKTWLDASQQLENLTLSHNDLMLVLDDINQSPENEVSRIIYHLMNGKQKRLAKVHDINQIINGWRFLVLSSGEQRLYEIAKNCGKRSLSGENVRLIDIPADTDSGFGTFECVPTGFKDMESFANHIYRATQLFFGTPLKSWIETLVQHNTKDIVNEFNLYKESFLTKICPTDVPAQVKRVAESFALLAFTGEYATQDGITGWDDGDAEQAIQICFEAWLSEFNTSDDSNEIIECAVNNLSTDTGHFIDYKEMNEPESNFLGWFKTENSKKVFLVPTSAYKKFFCNEHDVAYVDDVLRKAGVLVNVNVTCNPMSRAGKTTRVKKLIIPNTTSQNVECGNVECVDMIHESTSPQVHIN